MTKTIKTLTFATVLGTLLVSIGAVLAGGNNFKKVEAVCAHNGTHYTTKEATTKESGIREYWVCCKCHDHFLAYTDGEWVDGGEATNITDSNDDRYIPKTTEYTDEGFKVSSDGKTVTGFNPPADYNGVVVIPEGVDTIQKGAFANVDIDYVVVGEGVTIQANAFKDSGISAYGQGDDITIYLDMTRDQAKSLPSGWDTAYTQSLWGWGLIGKEDVKATVYYKGEWQYDANGNPKPIK